MSQPTLPPANSITDYIADGARIVAILLVWGIIAAFFAYGVGNIGSHGGPFARLGASVGAALAVGGFLNAVLYVVYRGIDYWHQY